MTNKKTTRKAKAKNMKQLRRRRPKSPTPPRTAGQYFAKTSRFQNLWDRVVAVISKLRSERSSLQQASREVGISPDTVKRWAGSSLKKSGTGRYQAKKTDKLLRVLMVPTSGGPREIAVRDSRDATLLGEYWNAVHRYLATGDSAALAKFSGKHIIDAEGNRIDLLTNLRELDQLGSAGVMSFESIYGRSA